MFHFKCSILRKNKSITLLAIILMEIPIDAAWHEADCDVDQQFCGTRGLIGILSNGRITYLGKKDVLGQPDLIAKIVYMTEARNHRNQK